MTAHEKPGRRPRRVILDTGPAAAAEGGSTGILVRRFLEYVRHERALSVNTQQAYQRDLRDFSAWLAAGNPTTLSVRDLGDYLAALSKRGLARASVARQAATLRTFYAFDHLRKSLGDAESARLVFGTQAQSVIDAIAINKVAV